MFVGNKPLVTAHSGSEGSEHNSLASVIAAVQANADIIELDIQSTSDAMPLLHHDAYISGVEEGKLIIGDYPFEQVIKIAKQSGKPFTALEVVLEAVRDYHLVLNLDLKDINSILQIKKLIDDFDMADSIIISGLDYEQVEVVRKVLTGTQVLLNAYYDPSITDENHYSTFVQNLCKQAIEVQACGINIDYLMSSEQLVSYARKRFLPISVWSVDDETEMQQMIDQGVYSITTHRPKRLREILG